jgi:hypothetical protein
MPAQIVSLWRRTGVDAETGEARVILRGGGLDHILLESHVLDLIQPRLRSRVFMNGLPIGQTGSYRIVVEHRQGDGQWTQAVSLPLDVVIDIDPNGQVER